MAINTAGDYAIATKILKDVEDPRKVVLDQLATVLDAIEVRASDLGRPDERAAFRNS